MASRTEQPFLTRVRKSPAARVFAIGVLAQIIAGTVVCLLHASSSWQDTFTLWYLAMLVLMVVVGWAVLLICRIAAAWNADGLREIAWVLSRPFGWWHDDPFDDWALRIAGWVLSGGAAYAVVVRLTL
jgi:hypothetical protein